MMEEGYKYGSRTRAEDMLLEVRSAIDLSSLRLRT